MASLAPIVVFAQAVTVVCGGLVTALAYRAYQRTCARPLAALTVGIGLITGMTLLATLLRVFTLGSGSIGIAIKSIGTATGFAILAYSLYTGQSITRIGGSTGGT
ncbi:MAG: hypothetical protein ABEJ35_06510 [Halobacteriaceae archaeon]